MHDAEETGRKSIGNQIKEKNRCMMRKRQEEKASGIIKKADYRGRTIRDMS